MIIRMRTTAAGPAGMYQSGKVLDVPDEIATQFVTRGYAEEVEETREVPPKKPPKSPPKKETATAEPAVETAMLDAPPRRRRKVSDA